MKEKSVQLTVKVTPEQQRELQKLAVKQHLSLAELLRQFISNPATFSRNNIFGFRILASLKTSKMRVPLISEKPPLCPATEKDWQGNPAQ